jgi:hydrogenase expression/formation protein HypC
VCLGLPGRVVEIDGSLASVDFFGTRRPVSLRLLDEPVAPGDFVLNHAGFAIRRIPSEEIGEMVALYQRLMELAEQDEPSPIGRTGER